MLFAIQNITFLGKDKTTHNLQAILYLAGCKSMVGVFGAKFTDGELQIDLEDFELFLPDEAYCAKYNVVTTLSTQ